MNLTVELDDGNLTSNGTSVGNGSWDKLFKYIIYFVEGGTMFLGNAAIAFAIWRFKALRSNKGYFVFAFMFFCDSLNGLAQLFASVYRVSLLIVGTHDVLVTRWDCMLKLHTYVWAFSEPCSAMMLAVISLDRILLVLDPGSYFKRNTITYISISVPFLWNFCALGIAFVLAYRSARVANLAQYCLLSYGLGKSYWAYHGFISVFGAALSILLYLLVIWIGRRRNKEAAESSASKQMLKSQKTLTKKMGASCITTLFVYLIPRLIGTGLNYSNLDRSTASSLMMIFYWIIGNFNSILNLWIFSRVQAIRLGVKALLTGKTMPPNLNLWLHDSPNSTGATVVRARRAWK